jgi:hypothetical protein
MIVSSDAPGCEWESASRAVASFSRRRRETVMLTRARSASSGRTRGCSGPGGARNRGAAKTRTGTGVDEARTAAGAGAASIATGLGREGDRSPSRDPPKSTSDVRNTPPVYESVAAASHRDAPAADDSARCGAVFAGGFAAPGTASEVTRNARRGGFSTGRSAVATNAASRADFPKNRGTTSAAFSGVRTLASSMTEDRQRSPLRSAASTAGYAWMSPAAVFRYCAAPAESLSSRRRKSKRLGYPSSTHLRSRSKPARAMRNSASAWCSRRRRSARWAVASRAVVMHASSHVFPGPPGTRAFPLWRAGASEPRAPLRRIRGARAGTAETSSGPSRRGREPGSEIRAETRQAPRRVAATRDHAK